MERLHVAKRTSYNELKSEIQFKYFLNKSLNVLLLVLIGVVNLVLLIKGAEGLAKGFYVFITIPCSIYLLCQLAKYNADEKIELWDLEESFMR